MSSAECTDHEKREGFRQAVVVNPLKCEKITQTCFYGQWVGPSPSSACEEQNFTRACDGQPHGTIVTGFSSPSARGGSSCAPANKTFLNGSWVGPEVYPNFMQEQFQHINEICKSYILLI